MSRLNGGKKQPSGQFCATARTGQTKIPAASATAAPTEELLDGRESVVWFIGHFLDHGPNGNDHARAWLCRVFRARCPSNL